MVTGIIRRLYVSAIAFLSQLVSSDPAINPELHLPAETQPPALSLTVNQETRQPPNSQPNQQPTNTESAVNQTSFPWAKIFIAFCLSVAMQIDLKYEQIDQHTKPYLKLYLRAACIALTFVSLILSHLIHDKFPLALRMLEKVGISLGFASFFIILALPLTT
ncbi:hypothetical protein NC653_038749 [Populus alba x Populus x berolinensis]|uniref:Uncharacterized protein n=1 Tax=Populus alba x Populus x berolinensis TaxID=444605 RepID=A0AAD6LHN7_9ROSI|nr:hypothetical protein NC653_038749 [Populus alba x Populus x berolinensis]